MILFESTTKIFPKASRPALDALSAAIRPGKITGVVGPDGAGKTTALRMVAGLLKPTSGRVEVFGLDAVRNTSEIREILGYMPQKFGLYEDLTVVENMTLYAKLRGLPRARRADRFEELLEFTGLARFQKRLARRLSGGMKQKLGLACALITTPKVLVLDEPGVGVDPVSRRELWDMVRKLTTDETVTLWSTAYLDEAELCDETALLNEGKLVFWGPPRDICKNVENCVVRALGIEPSRRRETLARVLRSDTVIDATIQGSAIRATLARPWREDEKAPAVFEGLRVVPARPNFEDGFVKLLGGAPKDADSANCGGVPGFDRLEVAAEARKLTKQFGSFVAASNIEFTIRRGEIFGLLGPNGAGKSTTFKMLCGLLRPTGGDGFVNGVSLRKAPGSARHNLGYMAQKFSLYGEMNVRQNLVFFSGVYGMRGVEREKAIERALDEYELSVCETEKAKALPLGYKQRLALACATIHSPSVLFLDEPTSGVDPLARREFWNRVNRYAASGAAVLVTTHFMDEAEYCDRLALILDGRCVAMGTPDELKASAATKEGDDPTMEDAFIRIVQRERARHE